MTLKELIEYAKEYAEEINERVQGKFENAKENYRSAKLATRRFISRHQLSLSILFAALVTVAVVGLAVLYVPAVAAFLSGLVVLGAAPFVGLTLLATALIAGGLAAAAVALTLAGLAKVIHSYRRRRIREKYSLNESDDEVDEYKNNSVVDYIRTFSVKHKFSLSILSAALAIGVGFGLTVFYVPAVAAFLSSIVIFGAAPFFGLTLLTTALIAGGLAAAAVALTVSLLAGLAKVFNNYQRRKLLYREHLHKIDNNSYRFQTPLEKIQRLEAENEQLRQQLVQSKQLSTSGIPLKSGGGQYEDDYKFEDDKEIQEIDKLKQQIDILMSQPLISGSVDEYKRSNLAALQQRVIFLLDEQLIKKNGQIYDLESQLTQFRQPGMQQFQSPLNFDDDIDDDIDDLTGADSVFDNTRTHLNSAGWGHGLFANRQTNNPPTNSTSSTIRNPISDPFLGYDSDDEIIDPLRSQFK